MKVKAFWTVLSDIRLSGFIAIWQGTKDTHVVYLEFGIQSQLVNVPFSLVQLNTHASSFGNVLVYFPIKDQLYKSKE